MDKPIHAANEMDKGETLPKVLAALAGVVIVVVIAGVVAFTGMWNPPAASKTAVQHTAARTL